MNQIKISTRRRYLLKLSGNAYSFIIINDAIYYNFIRFREIVE